MCVCVCVYPLLVQTGMEVSRVIYPVSNRLICGQMDQCNPLCYINNEHCCISLPGPRFLVCSPFSIYENWSQRYAFVSTVWRCLFSLRWRVSQNRWVLNIHENWSALLWRVSWEVHTVGGHFLTVIKCIFLVSHLLFCLTFKTNQRKSGSDNWVSLKELCDTQHLKWILKFKIWESIIPSIINSRVILPFLKNDEGVLGRMESISDPRRPTLPIVKWEGNGSTTEGWMAM